MSWASKTIGELCDQSGGLVQTGPFGSQLKQSEYIDDAGGVPVVMPKDIKAGTVDESEIARISENKAISLSRHMLSAGDIVFPRRGEISKRGYIKEGNKYFCGTGCLKIHMPDNEILNKYLFYYLDQDYVVKWLEGRAIGSTMLNLNTSIMRSVEIKYPDLNSQEAIVSTLDAYDDLIEINKRRIELLEESARQLYKEWFVRFRFPGHEHVKLIEGVPEGWSVDTFGSAFEFLGGFAFKSKSYVENGKYGVVTIKNVHDSRFVSECPSRVDHIPEKMKSHCKLKTGDILLSLTGNVGRACILFGNNFLLNQRVAKINPRNPITREFAYWTFTDRGNQRNIENLAYGVAQLNLSPVKLAAMEFIIPPFTLVEEFSNITSSIFDQIIKLNLSNVELAKARNLLLPKLMNGEIVV